jgi:hypothetical protein
MSGSFRPGSSPERASGRFSGSLRFGPSLVSVSALIWAGAAWADTTISTTVTAPVATSTAASGQPDNVIITGSVRPTAGAAVTLDSSNTVTITGGAVSTQDADNTTGILIKGGLTGGVTNTGIIEYDETAIPATNDRGIIDAPFAKGTGRFGIRLLGPGAFTGVIDNAAGGGITVQGNDSAGISLESALVGSVLNGGAMTVTGSRVFGIQTLSSVSGDVSSIGSITVAGEGAQAIAVGGDVGGGVIVQGSINVTGYRYTTRAGSSQFLSELGPLELLQGGPGVSVAGNVGKGFLVAAPPTLDPNNADVDGDGIPDAIETTGAITSYGAAPGVVVGAMGRSVSLSNVGTGATTAYGFVNNGTITGFGVYDGVTASGVQLGVAGGGAVTTGGGLYNSGTITAQAYAADATGLTLNSGATAPIIHNDGLISASLASDLEGTTARAIVVNAGASAPVLQNAGAIAVRATGAKGDAVAILDRSGTLAEIENVRTISAGRIVADTTQTVTGHDIAIDVSANTTGVLLAQKDISAGATLPAITGALMFGSGGDTLDIQAGKITGDISLGAGANALNISGGAAVAGRLTAAGGTLALNVGAGSLQINGTDAVSVSNFNLGTGSTLIVTADPSAATATRLNVSGTATIDTGAKIGVRLASISNLSSTFTVIQAAHLTAGAIDSSLLDNVPYLYTASMATNANAGTVNITVARKTAAQLGLSSQQSAAYDSLLLAVNEDAGLRGVVLNQTNSQGLSAIFDQLLPNHSGAVFHATQAAVQAFARPLDDRQDPVGGGFWLQEINTGLFADGGTDSQAYKAYGFGAVGGYEFARSPLGIVGVSLGAATTEIDSKGAASDQKLTAEIVDAGVYWRASVGGFSANARLAGDFVHVSSDRVASGLGSDGTPVIRTANGRWSGYGVNGRVMGSYEARLSRRVYLRPQVSADFLRIQEGSYTESGGGDGMNLAVDSRASTSASLFAGVALGAIYGDQQTPWGPEVLVGYRNVVSETLDPTSARFVAVGNIFSLRADQISGQGAEARLSLKGENGSGGFAAEAGAQSRDTLTIYDLRLTAHFSF